MSAFHNHEGSTFIEKGLNKLNYRIGPLRSDSVIKLVSDLITESDQAVWAVHNCNSWLSYDLRPFLSFLDLDKFESFIDKLSFKAFPHAK